ncbi:MAG: excinuclease ABC subunit UvrC [Cyanobacteria bacterium]|nr:excinuclease ABC subunit UvrC [Cyanobacteria bacterium CG_2015-16_32_12]NCO78124.1 excinuclease ABC subunit UvrC [Cyanobacteria bacterium CG_2015-22_32_23]NCQ04625.1 excinuclease ABC subunit UvrC [Cyanobacteria bacterium CG_2015-09_32_10]NCS84926.1 excinuclease ABC subunit UvrC [Cyanobacteria bacterium CG_2015-02_32_10]
MPENLENLLTNLPSDSGVYFMKDKEGNIIYIGKAKSLKKRVKSYFISSQKHSHRIALMVSQIRDIEFIVTDTEAEALALEANLIKQHQPHFNVLLKDDKKYPYVCITWSDVYPRIFITRKRRLNSKLDRYYGPYVDSGKLRETLDIIKRTFPLRQRSKPLYKDRPCLNYDIGKCPGVCQNLITPENYREIINKIALIFQGRTDELINQLTQQMSINAENLDFEKAAKYRDQIYSLTQLFSSQKVALPDDTISRDAIALAQDDSHTCIQLFQIRAGRLISRLGFFTDNNINDEKGEILQRVLEEHYHHIDSLEIPSEILVQYPLPDEEIFTNWLRVKKGKKVTIITPQKQQKAELISMVERNAKIELERSQKFSEGNLQAMEDLANILDLPMLPRRIEGYDISHIQGSNAVASRVVFIDGLPAKQHYRHYKIQNPDIKIGHSDDFASLQEIIKRRFSRQEESPDLVMIDGGKGQLSSVCEVLEEMNLLSKINVISLAKKREEIFLPNQSQPLSTNSEQIGVQLLRRLRDEAHRFAITFHRQQRLKASRRSILDDINGLGFERQKLLLAHFNSIDYIREATVKQLQEVSGIGENLAQIIYDYFHPNN